MLLEDYGQGKPLTARRIMAVKQAIDTWKGDMLPLKINGAKATGMIADASRRLGVEALDPENAEFAAVCLKKYGSGLPAKTARTLANYIVKSAVTDGIDEEAVEKLAKDMKGWREFDFGDPRLGKLGAKFVQRQKNYLKDTLPQSGNFLPNNPDVHSQLVGDANRGEWTICGTKFTLGSDPKAILAKFLESVKDSNARKVLSTLLNQSSLADMQTLLVKGNALIGDAKAARLQEEALYKIASGEMFVSRDTQHNGGVGISTDENVHYDLDISKDGKTATVTVSVDKNLNTIGARYDDYNIGTATISQRITVDLTKAMPEVTDVTFAQTFSPDRIKGAPA